ncbi:tripartite tricarboxylate transporter TctB family protein [Neoroseomonas soli]|uniref:Tripartite tricarboxylate transporter TctB family protein n=1 Tax=Neoroseomonas soli TaxID=1081025 RepID=A0A9X9WV80_9PROT|nr:tripartite tricarboxylate transporter TctB family protein [Neoroseomonas soli]MBR0671059.1 tripartite tricarboxylate transporter TctB family protein [Neoroseomonas soli]
MSEVEAESPFDGEKAPASPRADLVTAAVLLAFGLGIVAHSFQMPRFVEQSGTGLTAPGIVPGFHGTMIALLAILLGLRAARRGGWAARGPVAQGSGDGRRLALATGLGVLYAGVIVGRVPFWLASALFVFAFTAAFEWDQGPERRIRRLAEAALIGLGTGIAVMLVFEDLFLLRLP